MIAVMWFLLLGGFVCLYCYYGNKKTSIFYLSIGFFIVIVGIPATIIFNSMDPVYTIKERTLNISNERERISTMQEKLNKQITLISDAKSQYDSTMKDYISETNEEKRKYKITSFEGATERMMFNMLLIQEIDAYITKLIELKQATESGLEESIFMERRLTTKETMLMVTGNGKSLGKDIDDLLTKYNSYTEDFVIKSEDIKLKPLEEIWNQIQDEKTPEKPQKQSVEYGPNFKG